MIQRTQYIDMLNSFREKQLIKVVTGIRRCGKSTLFSLYCELLKKLNGQNGVIIKIALNL